MYFTALKGTVHPKHVNTVIVSSRHADGGSRLLQTEITADELHRDV